MAKIQDVITPKFHFEKQTTAPETPTTGAVVIYCKSDGRMYAKDDTGVEVSLTAPDINNLATLLRGSILPLAGAGYAGKFFLVEGSEGVADTLKICVKLSDNAYAWRSLELN